MNLHIEQTKLFFFWYKFCKFQGFFFFLRRNEYKYLAHHFLLVFCKRLFPPFGAFPWRRKSGALCFMEENPPPSKIRWKFMRSSRFSCFSTQFPSFPIIKNILWPFHLGCFGLFLAYFSRTVASVFAPFPSSLVAHTLEVSYVFVSVCGARRVQFVCPPLLTLPFPFSLPRHYHSPTHSWAVTGERCGLDSQRMQRTLKLLIAMVVSRNDKLSISVRATASF